LQDPGAASAGVAVYLCYKKVTTLYQAGDTITFTWSTGTPVSAIVVEEWANIDRITPLAVAETSANNLSSTAQPAVSRTPLIVGQLVYICAGLEGFSSYWGAQDSDTTGGSWGDVTKDEANTGTAATSVSVYGGYKVVTSTAAQTWNNTIGTASDWAACAVVFAKYISPINIIGTGATVDVVAGTGVVGTPVAVSGTPANVTVVAGTGAVTGHAAITGTPANVTVVAGVGQIQFPTTNITGTGGTVAVVAGTGAVVGNASVAGTSGTVAVFASTGTLTATTAISGTSATVNVIAGSGVLTATTNITGTGGIVAVLLAQELLVLL
jgi:hypothetical protein